MAFASLDQVGSHAKADVARVLGVIAGRDSHDATTAYTPVPNYLESVTGDLKGLRVGFPTALFGKGLDDEVGKSVKAVVDVYRELGAEIVDIELPHAGYAIAVYYIIATAEASSNLARFDGVRYGFRAEEAPELRQMYRKTREEGFGPEVKRRIMLGTYVLSAGYYDAYYRKAQQVRTLIKNDFLTAFKQCDAIITPTSPTPAFAIGEKVDDPLGLFGRGDVDIGHGPPQKRIAYAAADEAHLAAAGRQRHDHRLGCGRAHPGLRRQAHLAAACLRHGVCS